MSAAPWGSASILLISYGYIRMLGAEGMTNAQIGDELSVSAKTVNAHVEHILAKLGVSRRTEVAAWVGTFATRGADVPARSSTI